MRRRELLKRAGIAATVPAFASTLGSVALAGGETGFHFVAVAATRTDLVALTGDGAFGESSAEGGGNFFHVRAGKLLATGTWQAREVESFTPFATLGLFQAGILHVNIRLRATDDTRLDGSLRVVCNLPTPGGNTGHEEGITLKVGDTTFRTAGGLTAFTVKED